MKKFMFLNAMLVFCFGCDKSKDVSNSIEEKKDTIINNGITVEFTCWCGQHIISQGMYKNGDKIQCAKCGNEVTYQNGN